MRTTEVIIEGLLVRVPIMRSPIVFQLEDHPINVLIKTNVPESEKSQS